MAKKMTATEVKSLAMIAARAEEQSFAIATIEAFNYERKREVVATLADSSYRGHVNSGVLLDDPKASVWFTETYIERVNAAWSRRVKEICNARVAWRRIVTGKSVDDARKDIATLIDGFHLRGARTSDSGSYVEVRRGDESATLYIRIERVEDSREVNPDNSEQHADRYAVSTQVCWSSTSRTLNRAMVCVKLYQELIELAAEIEATMADERIYSTWGVERTPATPDVFNADAN